MIYGTWRSSDALGMVRDPGLKHSLAVHLVNKNVNIYDAAKMLGHTVQVFEKHCGLYLSWKRVAEVVVAMGSRP